MKELGVSVLIKVLDAFTAPLRNASARIKETFHTANEEFEKGAHASQAAEGVARVAERTREMVARPIESAESFEKAMARVGARLNATGEESEALEQQITKLRTSPLAAAQAMEALGHAGRSVNDVLTMMPAIVEAAEVDQADLATTAQSSTKLLQLFHLQAGDVGRALDVMAAGAAKSGTSMAELQETMRNVAESGSALGVTLEQTTALMVVLAQTGRTGFRAGGLLNQVFAGVEELGKKQIEVPGLNIHIATAGRNPIGVLAEMWLKTAKVSDTARLKFFEDAFGAGVGPVAQQLARAAGTGQLGDLTAQLQQSSGALDEQHRRMLDGLDGTQRYQQASERLSIAMGRVWSPAFASATEGLAHFVDGLGEAARAHPTVTKVALGSAGAVAALTTAVVAGVTAVSAATTAAGVYAVAMGLEQTGAEALGLALRGVITWSAAVLTPAAAVGAAIVAVSAAIYELVEHWGDLQFLWREWTAEDKPATRGTTEYEQRHGGRQPIETWTDADDRKFQERVAENQRKAAEGGEDAPVRAEMSILVEHGKPPKIRKLRADKGVTLHATTGLSMSGG